MTEVSRLGMLKTLFGSGIRLLAERRLPWRVTQWISRWRLQLDRHYSDYRVLATRPFLTGENTQDFEVHMLLGHKHVGMCLWSIKSFLHATKNAFTVVLHDDGSLTERDIAKLGRHLINARIVRKRDADNEIRGLLADWPHCSEYRFASKNTSDHRGAKYNMHIFALRLFDFNLMSNANKSLILDADVLFFHPPREIIDWATDTTKSGCLYSVEQYLPVRDKNDQIIRFDIKNPRPKEANAGLLCFDKRAFSLEVLESWIGSHKDLMARYATFEQAGYNHLIRNTDSSLPLPDSYSFNYTDDEVVATHFAIKKLFFQNLARLAKTLA